jgi:hypothetical protein
MREDKERGQGERARKGGEGNERARRERARRERARREVKNRRERGGYPHSLCT